MTKHSPMMSLAALSALGVGNFTAPETKTVVEHLHPVRKIISYKDAVTRKRRAKNKVAKRSRAINRKH